MQAYTPVKRKIRKNNRRRTKGRITQYVTYYDCNNKVQIRVIKH